MANWTAGGEYMLNNGAFLWVDDKSGVVWLLKYIRRWSLWLWLKRYCVWRIVVLRKVSVPKHLLLPFLLNLYLKKPPSLFMNCVLVQIQNLMDFPLLGLAFTRKIAALKISVSETLWHNTWQTWAALSVEKLRKQLTCLSHLRFL